DLDLTSACPMVEVDSEHTLAASFQRMLAQSQSALVSGWLEVPAHTFAASFQRIPALSQSALVRGWLPMSAGVAAIKLGSAHTLASSLQRMPALSQSDLVSGWLGASAASVIEATINPVANATIKTNAFINAAHECSLRIKCDTLAFI